jgi:hypothetical protein
VYNVEEVATNDIAEHFQADYTHQLRLPPHPSILSVLHHFTDTASRRTLGQSWDVDPEFTRAGSLFVLMQRMERTLKQLISERQHADNSPPFFSTAEFLEIAGQLTSAAAHLLTNRLVHRDVKPDNILLSGADAGRLVAKLADFGEALDAGSYCEDAQDAFRMPYPTPTPRGGANFYMPPEVLGPRPGRGVFLDYSKSDIWGIGMVMYAMLSREEPFAARDHREYSRETFRPLTPQLCTPAVAGLIGSLLEVDQRARPSAHQANESVWRLRWRTAHEGEQAAAARQAEVEVGLHREAAAASASIVAHQAAAAEAESHLREREAQARVLRDRVRVLERANAEISHEMETNAGTLHDQIETNVHLKRRLEEVTSQMIRALQEPPEPEPELERDGQQQSAKAAEAERLLHGGSSVGLTTEADKDLADALLGYEQAPPDEFVCVITWELMVDPVTADEAVAVILNSVDWCRLLA